MGHNPREIAEKLDMDPKDVYPMLSKARKEFRSALLETMAGYHPSSDRENLERECVELLSRL